MEWLPAEIVTLPTPFKPFFKICWLKEPCKDGEVFFEPLWVSKEKREYASSVQQQGEIRKWGGLVVKKRARYTLVNFAGGTLLAFDFIFLLPSP